MRLGLSVLLFILHLSNSFYVVLRFAFISTWHLSPRYGSGVVANNIVRSLLTASEMPSAFNVVDTTSTSRHISYESNRHRYNEKFRSHFPHWLCASNVFRFQIWKISHRQWKGKWITQLDEQLNKFLSNSFSSSLSGVGIHSTSLSNSMILSRSIVKC